MIKFIILASKRGQPRIRKHYDISPTELQFEPDLIKECLERDDSLCSFFEHRGVKIVYRKYASFCFIVGTTENENELAVLEFIHNIAETFTEYFKKVTEAQLLLNLDRVHMILDEMISDGQIVESSQSRILAPLGVMDQAASRK